MSQAARLKKARKRLGLGQARTSVVVAAIRERCRDAPAGSNDKVIQWFLKQAATSQLLTAAEASRRRGITAQTVDPNSLEFLSSYAWRQLRMQAIKKFGRRCQCCGANPSDGTTVINVDHIKPRRQFPALALDIDNLQVLCETCNHGKGSWDETDWRPVTSPVVAVPSSSSPDPTVKAPPCQTFQRGIEGSMKPRLVKKQA